MSLRERMQRQQKNLSCPLVSFYVIVNGVMQRKAFPEIINENVLASSIFINEGKVYKRIVIQADKHDPSQVIVRDQSVWDTNVRTSFAQYFSTNDLTNAHRRFEQRIRSLLGMTNVAH